MSLTRFVAASFMLVAILFAARADAEFKVPTLSGPVVDEAGVLSARTEAALERAMRALRDQSGTQITVLTVKTLDGTPIEQASLKAVDQWKLGESKTDRGVLLLVAPNDRKIRIEVGQGLEGDLTDVDSKRIIADSITPLFRSGDFDSGILVGVFQIARKTDPNVDLTSYFEGRQRAVKRVPEDSPPRGLMILIVIIVIFMMLGRLGGGRRGFHSSGWGGGGFGGGFGGGGGWGGGSGGGGGWSGGGGGFSGGGASGDW